MFPTSIRTKSLHYEAMKVYQQIRALGKSTEVSKCLQVVVFTQGRSLSLVLVILTFFLSLIELDVNNTSNPITTTTVITSQYIIHLHTPHFVEVRSTGMSPSRYYRFIFLRLCHASGITVVGFDFRCLCNLGSSSNARRNLFLVHSKHLAPTASLRQSHVWHLQVSLQT